jgi:selenocysteine-specific elongation factor
MFVVAATESWKPQSEEHLRILSLLGVDHGLIALTKVGLVDQDWQELVRMEIEERVAGTFLEGAEIIAVDAPTGEGLDELRTALDRLLASTPTATDRDRPRLWVDRSFAARGSGTVVTGTLAAGAFHVDDELVIMDGKRAVRVRVRALQSHQRTFQEVGPGHRLAVNVTGISHDQVQRGHALVRPGQWVTSRTVDASLHTLDSLDHDVSRRGAYQLYIGSGEYDARLRVLGAEAISAGGEGLVRLHISASLPLVPGDRYVLRESGRSETVGGGEVLDVDPVLPAAKAHPSRSIERVVAERGWVEADQLERLTGERREPDVAGRWVVSPAARAATVAEILEAIRTAGEFGLDTAVLSERQLALLVESTDEVVVKSGRARLPQASGTEELADHPWVRELRAAPFSPPEPVGVDRQLLRELVRGGWVIERDGMYFAAEAVDEAARVVAGLLADTPDGITVAAVRDALGTTRKHVLPLLAQLDGTGVTRRRGDVRIAGPRLPAP